MKVSLSEAGHRVHTYPFLRLINAVPYRAAGLVAEYVPPEVHNPVRGGYAAVVPDAQTLAHLARASQAPR